MGDHHYNAQAIRPMPDPNALYYYSNSPTRSLLLTNAYSSLSALRSQLETYGDVRALYTDVIPYGRVIVHFFDIKSAEIAFCTILHSYFYQLQRYYYLTRHHNPPLCAFYIILNPHAPPLWRPPFPQYHNQGTLVVFNLDSHVSNHTLHQSFLPYGRIREVRGSPAKSNVKFVEFFDVRDASKALEGMNGKRIGNDNNINKNVVIQFRRPGRWGYTTSTINNSYYYYYDVNFHNNNNNNSCYYNYVPRPLLSLPPPPANNLNQASKGEDYSQYEIKEGDDGNYVDSRTTLMIKNIANKYSQNDILNLLDKHCIKCNEEIGEGNDQPLSSYDFLYLPIDFGNECNMGYGFVNMTSPQAVLRLHKALHDKCCWGFGSRKICQITYAKYQGMEALKEKLKESKLIIGMEKRIEYTPIMFNPARDGKQVTKPESLWITPESDD